MVGNVFTLAEVTAKAALGQKIDIVEILKDTGSVALDFADAVCDPPAVIEFSEFSQ